MLLGTDTVTKPEHDSPIESVAEKEIRYSRPLPFPERSARTRTATPLKYRVWGHGYAAAKSHQLFRDFVEKTAQITIAGSSTPRAASPRARPTTPP